MNSENSKGDTLQTEKQPLDGEVIIDDFEAFLIQAKSEFEKKWASPDIPRANVNEFQWFATIGRGAFGRVMLARYKPTSVFCAVKVMEKDRIVELHHVQNAYLEMKMLATLNFRFLVYLMCAMKDNSYVHFTMPFIVGGEMYAHLQRMGRFTDEQTKFYAAQVCLALEYLHFLDIIHRDIKPENVLIDDRGYLKITDMGFCKIIKHRTYSFCGTPEYLPPEILLNKGYGKSVDWWSYGVLLYEMRAGYTPFYASDTNKMYGKIITGKYKNSANFCRHFKHLLSNILQVDPSKRYGNLKNGVNDIKNHKWFKKTNWLRILNYGATAPYRPEYMAEADRIPLSETPLKVAYEDKYGAEFENF